MCLSSFAYCWTFVPRILTKVRFSIWWYLTGFSCSNAVEHTKHQPIAEVSCFKSQWVLSLYFFHKTQIYSQICLCRCTAKKKRHSDQLQTLKSNNVFFFFISMHRENVFLLSRIILKNISNLFTMKVSYLYHNFNKISHIGRRLNNTQVESSVNEHLSGS